MGREESQEWDVSGWVHGVGLISWVNTKPLACLAQSTRSADAREARFYGEYRLYFIEVVHFSCILLS